MTGPELKAGWEQIKYILRNTTQVIDPNGQRTGFTFDDHVRQEQWCQAIEAMLFPQPPTPGDTIPQEHSGREDGA